MKYRDASEAGVADGFADGATAPRESGGQRDR
jgi:hypothetical protein